MVGVNRRLAHELARVGGGAWEVVCAAPRYFEARGDLRPITLSALPDEPCRLETLNAYWTGQVHLFIYGLKLRGLLRGGWDLVHCWQEPYIFAGWQVAWWTPPKTPLVYFTAQNLAKHYPPPFAQMERYCLRRAAAWLPCGRTVVETLGDREIYRARPHRVIPLGVDGERFRPDQAAGAEVRRSLGWGNDGPPVVGYLGRFVPEKGVGLLAGSPSTR